MSTPSRRPILQRQQRNNRGILIPSVVILLLLLIGAGLFYFVPSAKITLALQAKTFSQPIQLNASINAQTNQAKSVTAEMLTQNFSASGQGTANGTTRVGNAKATGTVTFTNTGGNSVVVPTGTVITTPDGIQFETSGQVLVPGNGSFPAVGVQAMQAGDAGNVAANTITVIPASSFASIAKWNNIANPTSIGMTVINPKGTDGGGATTVLAITQQNRDALTLTLHQKLQQEVKSWLASQFHKGDIQGKLTPDVLGSATPLQAEQLTGAPAAGQPIPGGTFNGSIALGLKVLVVRAAAIQSAATTQVNTAAAKQRPASIVATQLPLTLSNVQTTPSQDGNSLVIRAQANSQIIPLLDQQDLSNKLASKGLGDAKTILTSGVLTGQIGVKDVQISVWPSFMSFLPFRSEQIQIITQPIPTK
jgi:hypothetical protein